MSKYLEEKKNDLITRAEGVLNKAKEEKRELTDDEAQELAEIRDDIRRIKETLKLDDDFRDMKAMEKKLDEEPKGDTKMNGEKDRACKDKEKRAIEEQEERDFEMFLRGMINERANNLTPASGSGQALIPTTIANRIIRKVYDICPILERSSKYNVKGKLQIPYYDESTTAITVAYQQEFVAMQSNVGAFASIELSGYLAGALALVSRSLINNAQFNIVDHVVDYMAYAIKRFIENELLNGTASYVEGLSGLTNSITTASASAITADEVVRLHDAIKDEFQGNAIWIMSPATRTALRLLKSQTGYYLLNDDVSTPFGTTLLGKPVYVSDNMPDIGAGNTAIYYGDMKGLATKFSEDINIQVLREKYADMHAVGVIAWFEFDSKVEDAQKIAKLVCASA